MAIVTTDDAHYKNIASKIRQKLSTEETMFPSEMPEKIVEVYDAGYEKGKAEGGSKPEDNPFYYATTLNQVFAGAVFPENYEAVIKVKKAVNSSAAFHQCHNIKTIKLISEDNSNVIAIDQSFRNTVATPTLETVDLSEYNTKFSNVREAFRGQRKLKSIFGILDISGCSVSNVTNIIFECDALEYIRFAPNSIKVTINFNSGVKLTKASITSIIKGLSPDVNGQTVTLSKTAVNNAFETTAGAADGSTSEDWLNLISEKENWTISLS